MSLRLLPALILLAPFPSLAQEPDATAILRRVAQQYQAMQSQRFDATLALHAMANGMRLEMAVSGARMRPAKARLEIKNPMMSSEILSDGRHIWKYVTTYRQYTKKPVVPGVFPASGGAAGILAGEHVLDRLRSAKLLRQEAALLGGENIDCDVIEAEYEALTGDPLREEGPKTLWIDRRRGIILRISQPVRMASSQPGGSMLMTQTITVTSVQVDVRLPESLFVFSPPPGAKEVAEFTAPPAATSFRAPR